ncbi:hypothetical protein ES703_26361 [subsurface metagenome]
MLELNFKNKVVVLSIILAVLIATYVLGIIFSPANISRREAATPLFIVLDKDSIARIEIAGREEKVVLKKSGAAWTALISGIYLPASKVRIDSFLNQIIKLKRSRVVTRNPDLWQDFEVSAETGRRIRLLDKSDREVVNLIVGKAGPAGKGNYLRIEGKEEVIQVERSLASYMDNETKYWSHLKLFPGDLEGRDLISIDIRSRLFEGQSLDYTLVLSDGNGQPVWKVSGREDLAISADKVDRMANTLAGFEGTEFVVDIPEHEAGLASPDAEVTFRTEDDRFYRLLVGKAVPDENQYHVKLEGQTHCYLAAEWRLKDLLKPLGELTED